MNVGDLFAVLRLKDELSGPIMVARQNAEGATKAMAASTDILGRSLTNVNKLALDFAGANIAKRADEYAAAVARVGGATKLTEREQAQINGLMTEAIAKYRALGTEAPAHLVALEQATRKVEQATAEISPAASTAGISMKDLWGKVQGIAGAFGIGVGLGAVVGFTKGLIDSASHVHDLSVELGTSPEFVQRMQFALEQTGGTVENLSGSLAFMNKTLAGGSDSTKAALTSAGLSFTEIRAMSPEQAFTAIAAAIKEIPDPMLQARVAVDLFGKSGQEMLPGIKEGLIEIGKAAEVMSDETVDAIDEVGDAIGAVLTELRARAGGVLALGVRGVKAEVEFLELPLRLMAHGMSGVLTQYEAASHELPKVASAVDGTTRAVKFHATSLEAALKLTEQLREEQKPAVAAWEQYQAAVRAGADTLSGLTTQKEIQKVDDELTLLREHGLKPTTAALPALVQQLTAWHLSGGKLSTQQEKLIEINLKVVGVNRLVSNGVAGLLDQMPKVLGFEQEQIAKLQQELQWKVRIAGVNALISSDTEKFLKTTSKLDISGPVIESTKHIKGAVDEADKAAERFRQSLRDDVRAISDLQRGLQSAGDLLHSHFLTGAAKVLGVFQQIGRTIADFTSFFKQLPTMIANISGMFSVGGGKLGTSVGLARQALGIGTSAAGIAGGAAAAGAGGFSATGAAFAVPLAGGAAGAAGAGGAGAVSTAGTVGGGLGTAGTIAVTGGIAAGVIAAYLAYKKWFGHGAIDRINKFGDQFGPGGLNAMHALMIAKLGDAEAARLWRQKELVGKNDDNAAKAWQANVLSAFAMRDIPLSGFKTFNRGGIVPGTGDTDSVPALLTPGEIVFNPRNGQARGGDQTIVVQLGTKTILRHVARGLPKYLKIHGV